MGPILGESKVDANLWSFWGILLITMHCLGLCHSSWPPKMSLVQSWGYTWKMNILNPKPEGGWFRWFFFSNRWFSGEPASDFPGYKVKKSSLISKKHISRAVKDPVGFVFRKTSDMLSACTRETAQFCKSKRTSKTKQKAFKPAHFFG